MSSVRGWATTPSPVIGFLVLRRLAELDEGNGVYGPAEFLSGDLGAGRGPVGDVLHQLVESGHLHSHEVMASGELTLARLTPQGREEAERISALLGRRGLRIESCMEAMLDWLYVNDGAPNMHTIAFREDVRASYFGESLTKTDAREAFASLQDLKLVTGKEIGTGDVIDMAITQEGRVCVDDYDTSPKAWKKRNDAAAGSNPVTVNVHDSRAVTVAVNSPGASQTVTTTTDWRAQFLGLGEALSQTLPVLGLSQADSLVAQVHIESLKELAQQAEPEPGLVKRTLEGVKQLAVAGTGNAAGTGIVALVEQIAESFGG